MFSGRENQLTKLSNMLVKASNGEGLVALIDGEAGAGKTALINQFLELAKADNSNLVIATSTCVAIAGEGDAFHPFRQILRQIFSKNEKRIGNRFLEFVSSIAPAWFSVIPGIGSLIGAVIQTGVEAKKLGAKDSSLSRTKH